MFTVGGLDGAVLANASLNLAFHETTLTAFLITRDVPHYSSIPIRIRLGNPHVLSLEFHYNYEATMSRNSAVTHKSSDWIEQKAKTHNSVKERN